MRASPGTILPRLVAEAFGTFCLVFAGTGAVVVDEVTGGGVTHVGIALTFGLVVMAMICAVGHVSGAHLNPAVTLGVFAAGKFPGSMVPGYVGSQCLGALLASGTLRLLFPQSTTLGATVPTGGDVQSLVLEAILTLMLMVVILAVSESGPERGLLAGVAIGAEAFARIHGAGTVVAASAGSRPSGRINPKAIEAMKELGYDLTTHGSKGLDAFNGRPVDVAVTMGCGDECPLVVASRREDWRIPDPRDMSPEDFRGVRDMIKMKVCELLASLEQKSAGGAV